MDEDLRLLEEEEQNLLQAALSTAFSPPPMPQQDMPTQPQSNHSSQPSAPEGSTDELSLSEPGTTDDSWKAEYEAQVESWRAQSAEAREKAEKEREKWEAIRAAEKETARQNPNDVVGEQEPSQRPGEPGWETVEQKKSLHDHTVLPLSPSPADPRDLVTNESQKQPDPPMTLPGLPPSPMPPQSIHSQQGMGDESHKWEEVTSLTSSFPSMSFPERMETPPLSRNPTAVAPAPLSATLAIFDSSLSKRTRVTAFFSSLAINMLLPFVNGVMLGFGEIFAKNVVLEWFGWKTRRTGTVASTTGIGVARPSEYRQQRSR